MASTVFEFGRSHQPGPAVQAGLIAYTRWYPALLPGNRCRPIAALGCRQRDEAPRLTAPRGLMASSSSPRFEEVSYELAVQPE